MSADETNSKKKRPEAVPIRATRVNSDNKEQSFKKKKKVIWKTGSTNVQRNLDGHEITFYDIEFLFKELSNNLIEKIETLTMTVLPWRLLLLCRIMKTKCSKISFPFWLRAT